MSTADAVKAISQAMGDAVRRVASFRGTVTAVDGSLVNIQREGSVTPDDEFYASIQRTPIAVDDVVLCIPLGGKPVIVGVIRRAAAASPSVVALTAAGSTATASITGRDDNFQLTVNPSGSGIVAGAIVDITFAVARPSALYGVWLSPASGDARTLGGVVGRSGRTTTVVTLATATALTSGQTYLWDVYVEQR